MPLSDLGRWFDELELTPSEEARLGSVLAELKRRIRYMNDVGLEYLTLSRAARTLSGGEAQRIGLASALGGSLTGHALRLDEPTIGLHAADTRRLLAILRRLADRGNTVVVVEHDPEVIEAADHVIDLGPGRGSLGGRLLFEGTPRALARIKRFGDGRRARRRQAREEPGRSRRPRRAARRPTRRLPARRRRDHGRRSARSTTSRI